MDAKKLNKFTIKKFIKNKTSPGIRLQSLRLPRDLSLGGTKQHKKTFKPNLNVVRNKDKSKEVLKKVCRNPKDKNDKITNKQQRFVQSTGVFSEGIGNSFGILGKRVHTIPKEREKVTKPKKAPAFSASENIILNDIVNYDDDGDEKEEKLPFTPINWSTTELLEGSVKYEDNLKQRLSYLQLPVNELPLEYIGDQNYNNSNPNLTLWQLPDSFAFEKNVEGTKVKKLDCKLSDIAEGKIGKICVHKSGKTDVHIGSLKYELESTNFETSEEVVSLNIYSNLEKTACVLGKIENRFLLNPDWQSLLY